MCLISVKIATLWPHLLKIIYWKRLSTFLVIVQGMQLGNVYIICNILHQHLPLVILVCWNYGLNLTHAQFHKFHCCRMRINRRYAILIGMVFRQDTGTSSLILARCDPLPRCFFLAGPWDKESGRAWGAESLSKKKALFKCREARLISTQWGHSVSVSAVTAWKHEKHLWWPSAAYRGALPCYSYGAAFATTPRRNSSFSALSSVRRMVAEVCLSRESCTSRRVCYMYRAKSSYHPARIYQNPWFASGEYLGSWYFCHNFLKCFIIALFSSWEPMLKLILLGFIIVTIQLTHSGYWWQLSLLGPLKLSREDESLALSKCFGLTLHNPVL